MLLPQLLSLPLLLFLPQPSLLRPSGLAQMFNNWQSLQDRGNQLAFESAQGNRPDFPIQEQENSLAFERAQGNRPDFPIREQGNSFAFESAQGNRPDFPIQEQENNLAFESAQGNRPDFPIHEQGNDFAFERAQSNRPDFPIQELENNFALESAQGNRPDFPIQGQGNGLDMAPFNEGDYTLDDGRQYNRGVHVGRPTEDAGPPIETRSLPGQRPRYEVNEMATLPDPMSSLLNRQGGRGRFNGRFANGPRTGGGFRRRPGGSQVTGIGGRPPNTNGPRTGGGFRRRPVCIACFANGPR